MQISETSLGRFRFGGYKKSLCVSPDSRHVAYVCRDMWRPLRRREFLVVDGKRGRSYDRIFPETVTFADSGCPVFTASDRGKVFCVVGETNGNPFQYVTPPKVSPDGRRCAYVAKQAGRVAVVLDGQTGPWFESIAERLLVFSPDSRRIGYVARHDGLWRCIVDDSEGPAYDGFGEGSLSFSNDGTRFAYSARQGATWQAVVDGVAQQPWHGIADATPIFGPAGIHVVYGATDGKRSLVIVDGNVYGPYDGVGEGYVFSADGVHFAFRARNGHEWRVVTSLGVSRPYENVPDSAVVLSHDGKRLAFVGHRGSRATLVLDGADTHVHDAIANPTFSHDGTKVAYAAKDGSRWRVFLGGSELTTCSGTSSEIVFSPDDRHLAVEVTRAFGRPRGMALMVDGEDRTSVDFFLKGARPFWDGSQAVHDLGCRDREYIFMNVETEDNGAAA